MSDDYTKAIPVPGPESLPFWEGAKNHQLMIQKCLDCGHHWFPPSTVCTGCGSRNIEWVASSGKGTVFSFVVFHKLYHKGWDGEIPYAVAIIELEEGARMLSNVIGVPVEDVKCDIPVEVVFEDATDTLTLPKFKPI
jgi:uncharacterized protein